MGCDSTDLDEKMEDSRNRDISKYSNATHLKTMAEGAGWAVVFSAFQMPDICGGFVGHHRMLIEGGRKKDHHSMHF